MDDNLEPPVKKLRIESEEQINNENNHEYNRSCAQGKKFILLLILKFLFFSFLSHFIIHLTFYLHILRLIQRNIGYCYKIF